MAKCEICDKKSGVRNRIIITRSQTTKRNKTPQKANIKTVRVLENGERKKKKVCVKCIKSGKVEKA